MERLDGNYTRMLHAVLNKSWKHQPKKYQLYGQLPSISQTIQDMLSTAGKVRINYKQRFLMDAYTWMYQCWLTRKDLHQLCADYALEKTCQKQCTIDTDGERERVRELHVISKTR